MMGLSTLRLRRTWLFWVPGFFTRGSKQLVDVLLYSLCFVCFDVTHAHATWRFGGLGIQEIAGRDWAAWTRPMISTEVE